MMNFEERKAEIFRRSNNRIIERRKKRRRALGVCIPLCLILIAVSVKTVFSIVKDDLQKVESPADTDESNLFYGNAEDGVSANENPDHNYGYDGVIKDNTDVSDYDYGYKGDQDGSENKTDIPKNFSFSLTWNVNGCSSYNCETGELIKFKSAKEPKDYTAQLYLSDEQKIKIWNLLCDLNIDEYPKEYDPHGGTFGSDPSMTLILTVKYGSYEKTVTAENIALSFNAKNTKGQKFLDVCKGIKDILTSTDEWKSLPEYEYYFK